jgi:hypothetical protein
MKRIAHLVSIAVVLGSALLSTIALAEAPPNQAVSKTSGKVIAPLFYQLPIDPPGDGGGGPCTTQWCYRCGSRCQAGNPDNCWSACIGATASGACSCNFPGGICQPWGECSYTP